jgi:hypothetical protein
VWLCVPLRRSHHLILTAGSSQAGCRQHDPEGRIGREPGNKRRQPDAHASPESRQVARCATTLCANYSHGLGRDYSVTPTLPRRRPGGEMGQSPAQACVRARYAICPLLFGGEAADVHKGHVRHARTLRGRDPDERRERCVPHHAASGEVVLGARLQHDLRLSPKSGVPDLGQRRSLSSRNMAQSPPTSCSRSPPCHRDPSYNRDHAPGRPARGTSRRGTSRQGCPESCGGTGLSRVGPVTKTPAAAGAR